MLDAVWRRQVAWQVEQALLRVVERTLPIAGGRTAEAELALVEREVAADGQCCRSKNPRARVVGDLLGKNLGHRKRRRAQLPPMHAHIQPSNPLRVLTRLLRSAQALA